MDVGDAALVRRAREGDVAGFTGLVHRHYADCLRYATRVLGDRCEAEEVVQDAFVRAYRALGRYDERDNFRGWLFRILVNRCRTRGAGLQRRRRGQLEYETAQPRPAQPEDGDGRWTDAVQRALARLGPEHREAFLLRYVEDLSYEEMASVTGAGVSALKMRVKRARERMRRLLEEERA